jgi:ubiquinone/menaquinone biosynthesis C-methylase UbiE
MSDRFYDLGAAEYDQICGFACLHFVPALLRHSRISAGQRVLDVATGTGNAAEAAAEIVGASGSVMATDISVGMLDEARRRLATLVNVSFAVENGQELTLKDASFDAVVRSMGR